LLELSFQARLTWVREAAVAVKLLGAAGAVVVTTSVPVDVRVKAGLVLVPVTVKT
jgi:hypothetical protein